MTQQGSWRAALCRGLAPRAMHLCLAALLLGGTPGCLSFVHSIDPPTHETAAACESLPQPCRNHVYVFLIHGMDPLDFANLSGVAHYIESLGFPKTYYGQMYHLWTFKKEVRRINKEDPCAHFVLIGFSFGANLVRELANSVKDDGVHIDLLVYLGGNTLENTPPNRPDHVDHIVNILATGCIWNGTTLDRADNIHYNNVWHFGSPTHPQTLQMLARELAIVAARVPIVERVPDVSKYGPQPRPYTAPPAPLPPPWKFLEPRQPTDDPAPPENAPPPRPAKPEPKAKTASR
jgi:hypothetical protein